MDENGTDLQKKYAKAAPLVKAMLNYGTVTQNYFGVNTDKPANADLSDDDKVIADVTAADINKPYDDTNTVLPDDVTFDKVTLSLKSETTLSLYFTSDKDLTFSCGDNTVDVEHNDKTWIARIRGVKSDEIGDDFTLTVSDGTTNGSVTYSPMTYCYNVISRGINDAKLKNVVKSLYLYWTAAKAFFI